MNVNRRSLNKKKKKKLFSKFIFEMGVRNCSGPVRNKTNVNVNVRYIFSKFNFEMESRTIYFGILLKKKLTFSFFSTSPFFSCIVAECWTNLQFCPKIWWSFLCNKKVIIKFANLEIIAKNCLKKLNKSAFICVFSENCRFLLKKMAVCKFADCRRFVKKIDKKKRQFAKFRYSAQKISRW